jgi:hypothetical protein
MEVEVGLVNQRRGVEAAGDAHAAERVVGDLAQVLVHEGDQVIEGLPAPLPGLFEEAFHLLEPRHDSASILVDRPE